MSKKAKTPWKACSIIMKALAAITGIVFIIPGLFIGMWGLVIVGALLVCGEVLLASKWKKKALEETFKEQEKERLAYEREKARAEEQAKREETEKRNKEACEERKRKLYTATGEQIICLDLETTGFKYNGEDEILQLSIIDGDGKVLFNEYIKPERRKQWPKAEEIHGISPVMVKDKPTIEEHLPVINEIIARADVLVGYNIIDFDAKFLKAAGVDLRTSSNNGLIIYDVMQEFAPIYGAWSEYHQDYTYQKLSRCAKYYGYKSSGNYHDSLEDARATLFCFIKMIENEKNK